MHKEGNMLLEFETENYKSFKDRIHFSMIPAPKQKGLDYSILRRQIEKKEYRALSSAVIYGPNAAGKTNIIGAMQTFKNIVLRGNIKNAQSFNTPNAADYALELIPNNTLAEPEAVFFLIKFIKEDLVITYSLRLDLGNFFEREKPRAVLEEILEVNAKEVFRRKNNELELLNIKYFEKFLISDFKKNFETVLSIAQKSLKSDDLFLTNGFKTIVSPYLADFITEYFSNSLRTVYHADNIVVTPVFDTRSAVDVHLNEAMANFGIHSNKLAYIKSEKKDTPPVLCSVLPNKQVLPAELFESYGTVRFVNIYPLVADALRMGATLVVDEFDSSIHPMAIMSLITIFHNDEVNKNNAQLIFNTHNPLYLNNNLFRRDEIKFIDRDDETQCSRHYSLSDFGTKGTNARKGKDYMNNYFMDEYGAIRDIDFTDVFKKIVEES